MNARRMIALPPGSPEAAPLALLRAKVLRICSTGLAATPRFIQLHFAPDFMLWEIAQACDLLHLRGKLCDGVFYGERMFYDQKSVDAVNKSFRKTNRDYSVCGKRSWQPLDK